MSQEQNANNNASSQNGGVTKPEEKKVRKHKQLGEYKKCIVHLTKHAQQNTSVFVSINISTFEFQPGVEVELPEEVIKFLKNDAVGYEHYFDKDAVSENGNKGIHKTREVKKYIVELLD